MPCHPDRVRRNYEAGRAAVDAASWRRPSDTAAEQLERRSEPAPKLPGIRIIPEGATHARVPDADTHRLERDKVFTPDQARAIIAGWNERLRPDEPDEDCLWGV